MDRSLFWIIFVVIRKMSFMKGFVIYRDEIDHNCNTIHIQIQADSVVSGMNGLLTSGFGSSKWGERHNSYYADPSPTHLVMFKISVGRDPKNPTTPFNNQSNSRLNGPISTDSFSKSSYSQGQLFWAWRHPHSSSISCLFFFFILTMVIVISFAREHKTMHLDS